MKTCTRCKKPKDESEFYKNRSKKDGLDSACKACHVNNNRTDEVRKRQRNYMRVYYLRPEAGKKRKEYTENPVNKERRRILNLLREYGLSGEEFKKMLRNQEDKCAICKEHLIKPCVDHCHSTGKVRGILCNTCNLAIGYLKDDPDLLKRAIEYLTLNF